MPKKQEKHPNLWSGSDLGGFPGAGTKPNVVRKIALSGALNGTKYAARVAEGCKVVPIMNASGVVTGYRFPNLRELEWAIEYCARLGVPTKSEVTLERPEMLREIVDAMRAEKIPKEKIAAVVKRLGEAIRDQVG